MNGVAQFPKLAQTPAPMLVRLWTRADALRPVEIQANGVTVWQGILNESGEIRFVVPAGNPGQSDTLQLRLLQIDESWKESGNAARTILVKRLIIEEIGY